MRFEIVLIASGFYIQAELFSPFAAERQRHLLSSYLLLKKVLGSFAVVTKEREKVSGHVKLKLSRSSVAKMIGQDHLKDRRETWTYKVT